MENIWRVGTSFNKSTEKREDIVTLMRSPWWASLAEQVLDASCVLSRHTLCGTQEWTHRVPLSLKKDADGFWERTLGSVLYAGFTDAVFWVDRHQDRIVTLPITPEQTAELEPEASSVWE